MASLTINEARVTVDGLSLRYLEAGAGPAVVMMHGASLGSSCEAFEDVIAPLAEAGYRVVAYDQPGYGLSDNPADYRVSYRVALIPQILDALGMDSAALVGHSQAGGMAVRAATAERFDRYDGERLYHFGISVEGYVLAQPGIPLVFAPKSILILNLTVWDDAKNMKLNPEPHQITVFESLDQGPVVGSGYTKSAEEQLKNLSQNAAKSIETYLVKQNREEGWFSGGVASSPAGEPEDK